MMKISCRVAREPVQVPEIIKNFQNQHHGEHPQTQNAGGRGGRISGLTSCSHRTIGKKKALTLRWEGPIPIAHTHAQSLLVCRGSIVLLDSRVLSPLGEQLFL